MLSNNVSHTYQVRHNSIYSSLKTAEKKAASYCINYPERIVSAAISDIATEAGCSEATLVRLARRMGYTGFPELRMMIMNHGAERDYLYEDISKQDSLPSITEKVFQTSIQALVDTRMMLSISEMQKAVDSIKKAGKILFCGVGDANAVAMSGYQKFSRLGLRSEFTMDFDTQLLLASQMKQDDVLFCISHSGRTKNLLTLQKIAKEREATVISITNFPTSPIAKASDIILLTATFTKNLIGEVMTKRVAELCILEALYVTISVEADEEKQKILHQVDRVLLINKTGF